MTGPPDPIQGWLSSDVELLPAPPGAFERVHKRARRRKTVRTAGTAAGAAVIIAAVAVLPQVAGGLLPGGNGGPASIGSGKTTPASTHASRHPSTGPSPAPSGSGTAAPSHGPALASAGTGPGVAAGFRPTSVTFVGPSLGAVLGRPGSGCTARSCTVAAATPDYGRHWTTIGAPAAGAPDGSAGVSQIRFNGELNGWAYGPALYATHDGGVTWGKIRGLPGRVTDLSTIGGSTFAVVARCSGTGPDYAAGCTSFALYQTPVSLDRWRRVPGASAAGPVTAGGLQLNGVGGYLIEGNRLFAGPAGSGDWHQVRPAAATEPWCLSGPGRAAAAGEGSAVIAPDAATLYLACDAAPGSQPAAAGTLALYVSQDGGQTWQRGGPISAQGTATSLAAIPGGALVLATTAGLYVTADAVHWRQARLIGATPAAGFGYVGLTNTREGVAVPAGPVPGALFVTLDGGLTWRPVPIR